MYTCPEHMLCLIVPVVANTCSAHARPVAHTWLKSYSGFEVVLDKQSHLVADHVTACVPFPVS